MSYGNIFIVIAYALLVAVLVFTGNTAYAAVFSALAAVFLKNNNQIDRYSRLAFLSLAVVLLVWTLYQDLSKPSCIKQKSTGLPTSAFLYLLPIAYHP